MVPQAQLLHDLRFRLCERRTALLGDKYEGVEEEKDGERCCCSSEAEMRCGSLEGEGWTDRVVHLKLRASVRAVGGSSSQGRYNARAGWRDNSRSDLSSWDPVQVPVVRRKRSTVG